MGHLVDKRDGGFAREYRVEVHLLERCPPVRVRAAGNDLEVADLLERVDSPVGLDVTDHHVRATRGAAGTLVEHGEGLADPRGGPEIDAQGAASHGDSVARPSGALREPRVRQVWR